MVDEFAWITQSRSVHTHQHQAFTWELEIRIAAIAAVVVDSIIEARIVIDPADPADHQAVAIDDPAVTIDDPADPPMNIADPVAITVDPAVTTRITTHLATRARTAAKWLNILLYII